MGQKEKPYLVLLENRGSEERQSADTTPGLGFPADPSSPGVPRGKPKLGFKGWLCKQHLQEQGSVDEKTWPQGAPQAHGNAPSSPPSRVRQPAL